MKPKNDKSRWSSWSLVDTADMEKSARLEDSKELKAFLASSERQRALKEQYIESLSDKLETLQGLWHTFRETGSPGMLSTLHRHCHDLSGSGSMFGFQEISRHAKTVERTLQWLLDQEVGSRSLPLDEVSQEIDELQNTLREAYKQRTVSREREEAQASFEAPSVPDEKYLSGDDLPGPSYSELFTPTMLPEVPLDLGESSFSGTVWVLEDDEFQARDLQHKLAQSYFICQVFATGEEMLKQAVQVQPDLIILDLIMKGLDGFQVFQKLRDIPGYEDVPMIFLSSSEDEEDIVKAYQLGANDFITKPVNPSILNMKLRAMISQFQEQRKRLLQPGMLTKGMMLAHRYRIIEQVGQGGMGFVYLVEDLTQGEVRALKILNSQPGETDFARERFRREINALRQIHHPHLVTIYEAGAIGELHYYTMDYLPGGGLAHRLDEMGMFTVSEALSYTEKIASALQCLHEHHILHRDIKPENILFSVEGEPILTDLGLAMNVGQSEERLTKTGQVIGTVEYMAPEQIISSPHRDHRMDIYALGMILYEMLAGLHPLEGIPFVEMMVAILRHEIPPLSNYNSDVPSEVAAICEKAIQHDLTLRFSSAESMKQAIQAAQVNLPRTR